MFHFKILNQSGAARRGILSTPHGEVETPAFIPVATKGALKGIDFDNILSSGAQMFMMNTFHFFCNEQYQTVFQLGGLHRFLGREFPIMTDSGGFQVFSLGTGWELGVGKLSKEGILKNQKKKKVIIDEEGVTFQSPSDGRKLRITPEIAIKIQEKLGADIIFTFDECTSPLDSREKTEKSLTRSHQWAERCLEVFQGKNQALLGIIQGGPYSELRRASAQFIGKLPFFGFGIGGSFGGSYGDSKERMYSILDETIPLLPELKLRHLLGIGEPDDILAAVERGVDLFDCVIPTRWARHGTALTQQGRVNLKSVKLLKEEGPIDPLCLCRVCQNYSLAYLSHLLREKEMVGISLLAEHNLFWLLNLMREIREAITKNKLSALKKKILKTTDINN